MSKKDQVEITATEVDSNDAVAADIKDLDQKFDTSKNKDIIHLPFNKCWELFWTNRDPPKPEKRPFYFWFPPGQSGYEKRLVFKLDCAIMSYVCLSYFVRYLDAQNVSSAYVSGMKEDLNLSGTDYNWLTQLFGVAYSVAGPFTNTALGKFKAHHLLPCMEILWGLMCLLVYRAQNFRTVALLRFVQGFCEGAAWPAIHYILGSWYTPSELAKRVSIFTASGSVGTLLSGLIQSGLKRHMDGKAGLEGWRWLFIIDAVITFPIAFYGFFIFPDVPNNATPRFYLSEEDIQFCRERVKVNGKHRVDRLDSTIFKRVFTSYNWYLFVILWTIWGFVGTGMDFFGIALADLGYNVYDRNNIPTSTKGVSIVSCILSGFIIDIRGKRWEVAMVASLIWIGGCAIVYAWNVPRAALIVGFCMQAMSSVMSPTIVGWCNELAKEDDQLRAVTVGSLNFVGGLIGVPYNVLLFNTDYGPRFQKGYLCGLIFAIIQFFYMFLVLHFDRYQNRKREYIKSMPEHQVDLESDEEAVAEIKMA